MRAAREPRGERVSAARARIESCRPEQRAAFEALKGGFAARVAELDVPGSERYLALAWGSLSHALQRLLLPAPTFAFLQHPLFLFMMAGGDVPTELANVRNGPFSGKPELLMEDAVGEVPGLVVSCLSSVNQLHHLSDLSWLCGTTRCRLEKLGTIVEWGGGYGGMAKLLRRLRPGVTYVLIDIPLIGCIQWLYLASIFGAEAVHQIRSGSDVIRPGRINLLPLPFLELHGGLRADLFVSTFALDESSAFARDFVVSRRWFSARHLLLAGDDRLADAGGIMAAAARRGARLESGTRSGQSYALL
ncbi:MAG: hypothetical protein ACHQ49_00755 [Elusimicrobiota bacterium]